MIKTYLLDTNVLLHDAESIFKFADNNVIIPITSLEELDRFKKEQNETGRNARATARYLDELREKGSLVSGLVVNDQGGTLRIAIYDESIAKCLPNKDMSVMDNRILATAKFEKENQVNKDVEVILVTKDINLRISSDVQGISCEDYKNDKIETDDLYTGIENINVQQHIIDKVYLIKKLDMSDFDTIFPPLPNQCFVIHSNQNTKQSALIRYNSLMKEYNLLPMDMKTVDILPRNVEQQFALDLLKDPEVNLVSLVGKAGSGKTMMALASALYGVLETQRYSKILLLKPIVAMDNNHELGFLPGSMEEKLSPWMASYADNIELIMDGYIKEENDGATKKRKVSKKEQKERDVYQEKDAGKINPIQELIAHGLLELGSMEHIRGRSLPNQFIIVDECQNLTLHAIKTLITRVGEGTKIVLLGDISQIDSPYLDSRSNGLTIIVEKFRDQQIAGHITMRKSERSKLAEIASDIL